MGADDREIHIEKFDPMAIHCELAIRMDEAPDPNGVSVETTFDHDGLYATLRDKYGTSRSVRLVLAPDEPPSAVQDAPLQARLLRARTTKSGRHQNWSRSRGLTVLVTRGRTLKYRAVDVLAYFDRPRHRHEALPRAINERPEHIRGCAVGVSNLTN